MSVMGVTHAQETCNRNLHVTKIVCFDWSAVFENFWYQKLVPNRAVFYYTQASGTSFLIMFHPSYATYGCDTAYIVIENLCRLLEQY